MSAFRESACLLWVKVADLGKIAEAEVVPCGRLSGYSFDTEWCNPRALERGALGANVPQEATRIVPELRSNPRGDANLMRVNAALGAHSTPARVSLSSR